MNAIKNVVILVLSALLVAVQCTGRDSENPDDNSSDDNRISVTTTPPPQSSGKIVFAGTAGTTNKKRSKFWAEKGNRMLRQQMDQGAFSVVDSSDTIEHPMVGFKVPREILLELMKVDDSQIPKDFSGIYLMPAVRPCDLDLINPKYTIMVGALLQKGKGDQLDTESVRDFFKPCPDLCTSIIGFNYSKDEFSLQDGELDSSDNFKAHLCPEK